MVTPGHALVRRHRLVRIGHLRLQIEKDAQMLLHATFGLSLVKRPLHCDCHPPHILPIWSSRWRLLPRSLRRRTGLPMRSACHPRQPPRRLELYRLPRPALTDNLRTVPCGSLSSSVRFAGDRPHLFHEPGSGSGHREPVIQNISDHRLSASTTQLGEGVLHSARVVAGSARDRRVRRPGAPTRFPTSPASVQVT